MQYLLLASLLPLVAVSILGVVHTRSILIDGEIRNMRMVGAEVVREISALMGKAESDLSVSAVHPELRKADLKRAEAADFLRGVHGVYKIFTDITLYDRDGSPMASSQYSYREDVDVSPWFGRALDGEVVITPPHRLMDRSGLYVTLYQPVRNNAWEVFRVLVARLSLSQVWQILNGAELGGGGKMVLVDPDGSILCHFDRERDLEKFRDLGDEVMLGHVTEGIQEAADGSRKMFVSLEISETKTHTGEYWRLISIRPYSAVVAALNRHRMTLLGIGGLTALLSVLIGIVFSKRLADPIRKAAAAASDISKGCLDVTVPSEGFREVGELASAMNKMTAEVKQHRLRLEHMVKDRTQKLEESGEQLQDITRRHELILNAVGEGIFGLDIEGQITFVNPLAARLLGWTPEELLGKMSLQTFHYRNKDGSRKTAEECRISAVVKTGLSVFDEDQIFVRRDMSTFPVRLIATPIFGDSGGVEGTVVAFQDISAERAAEAKLQESEEYLRQTQKMEAIGRLAGGVAHDFNNLLTAILGHVELLRTGAAKESPILEDLDEIKTQIERGERLTRQLLAFSKRQLIQPQVLDLNEIVQGMQNMLIRLLGEDIEIVFRLAEGLQHVKMDRGQVEQIIMNLAVNAREAMPDGGLITIETRSLNPDTTFADISSGSYAVLEVRDSGEGMSNEVMSQIFEPFFTTKPAEKGSGIGLSTVYGIVSQSTGIIHVDSAPGEGSVFTIFLPEAEEGSRPPSVESGEKDYSAGSGRVLLAEDEDALRRGLARLLKRKGYEVIEASDGVAALEALERSEEPIQVLVTDIVMPRMDGRNLADKVKEVDPKIAIVFMSGYTEHILTQGNVAEDEVFVQKPFAISDMLSAIAEAVSFRQGSAS